MNAWEFARTSSMKIRITSLPLKTSTFRSEEHTSELQSQSNLVCRLLLEKKHLSRHRYCTLKHYFTSDAHRQPSPIWCPPPDRFVDLMVLVITFLTQTCTSITSSIHNIL